MTPICTCGHLQQAHDDTGYNVAWECPCTQYEADCGVCPVTTGHTHAGDPSATGTEPIKAAGLTRLVKPSRWAPVRHQAVPHTPRALFKPFPRFLAHSRVRPAGDPPSPAATKGSSRFSAATYPRRVLPPIL